jgi:hypothetical protein
LKYDSEDWVLNKKRMSTVRNSTNEVSEITFRTENVRPSKE